MSPFIQFLLQFAPLTEAGQQALSASVRHLILPRGHMLVAPNRVSHELYFIESGLSRTFYYKDGIEVTDWLSTEGEIAGSIVSFLSQQPDCRMVQLLEPSVVWAVPYQPLETLYTQYHDVEHLGRLLVSHGLLLMQQRFDDLHLATATQRYQKLMASRPTLLQRVPMGMLASYLGMAPETLSRIRAKS